MIFCKSCQLSIYIAFINVAVSLCNFMESMLDWLFWGFTSLYTTVTLPKPTVARQSVSKKWENRATSSDCRPTSAPNFWSADDFLVEAPKLKVPLTNPPIFMGFVIGEASGGGLPDDRPTIGQLFEDFVIMISAEGRPIIGRQSADDRKTVGRWHFIKKPSEDRRRISAFIRPMITRLSADHNVCLYICTCVILFTMHGSTLIIVNLKISLPRNVLSYELFLMILILGSL